MQDCSAAKRWKMVGSGVKMCEKQVLHWRRASLLILGLVSSCPRMCWKGRRMTNGPTKMQVSVFRTLWWMVMDEVRERWDGGRRFIIWVVGVHARVGEGGLVLTSECDDENEKSVNFRAATAMSMQ